jgi:hypothetical protein
MSFNIQLKVMEALEYSNSSDWERIIDRVLKSKSEIIIDLVNNNTRRILLTIKWMDTNNYAVVQSLESRIFRDYKRILVPM